MAERRHRVAAARFGGFVENRRQPREGLGGDQVLAEMGPADPGRERIV